MKRVILLLIGILTMCIACQDVFVEPENGFTTKSAKCEKTQTFQINGWAEVIPDWEAGMYTCNPEELGIEFCTRGWVTGHENILGTIVRDESVYEKQSCDVTITDGVPVVYNVVYADILRRNGNRTFVLCHMWINLGTMEIWGHNELVGGTGRFEGISGTTYIRNAKMIPETGGISWEEDGEITLILK